MRPWVEIAKDCLLFELHHFRLKSKEKIYFFEGCFTDLFLISQKEEATVADCWNKDQNDWDLGLGVLWIGSLKVGLGLSLRLSQ